MSKRERGLRVFIVKVDNRHRVVLSRTTPEYHTGGDGFPSFVDGHVFTVCGRQFTRAFGTLKEGEYIELQEKP